MTPNISIIYFSLFRRLSKLAAQVTVLVGLAVLVGWWLDIAVLKSIVPGLTSMKANTALAFLSAGLTLWLLQSDVVDSRRVFLRRACAALVTLIGLLTLSQDVFGWDLRIDQLLFMDPGSLGTDYPGRMSPVSALNFVLLGSAMLLIDLLRRYRTAQIFTFSAALLALFSLIGYLYQVEYLYRIASFTSIALHTSITFLILSTGTLLVRPDQGWMAVLSSDTAGGVLARRLLPAAVIVPVALGWIRLGGQNVGLYGTNFGLALFAGSNILLFTILIAWSAGTLFRIDSARRGAEASLLELNNQLEVRVEQRTSELTAVNSLLTAQMSERERAENELRASEAKLRALFEVLPVGISILDRERQILESNLALDRILDLGPEDLASGAYATRKYIRPDGTEFTRQELPSVRAFQEQRAVLDIEIGVILATGKTVWTSVSAVPVPQSDVGVVVVTTDITERKGIEAALRQERDLLQALMDNIPDTIYFKDTASRFTRINRAQARVLGVRDVREAIGKTEADLQVSTLATAFQAEEQELFRTGQPIIDRKEYNPTADGQPRWFSATKVPLVDKNGQVTGLIGISRDITERIKGEEAVVRSNAELVRRVYQMSLLNELQEQLQACIATDEVYRVTAQLASRLFPAESGALYIITHNRIQLESAVVWGVEAPTQLTFGLEDCWALRRGHLNLIDPCHPNVACPHLQDLAVGFSACVPMQAQDETLGIMHFRAPSVTPAHFWEESTQQLATVVADSVGLALANLNLREKLRQQSIHDPLTNLYNRRYMQESLEREVLRAARRSRSVGVIMLDVDHFKQVNDQYGHAMGDEVMRQLGCFLNEHIRGSDIACRFGGDEFIIIMPELTLEQARLRAEQHREGFKTLPFQLSAPFREPVSISLGVASYPLHGSTADQLLRNADAALYLAKRGGRDQVAVFE